MRRILAALWLFIVAGGGPAAAQVSPAGAQSAYFVYLYWSEWSADNAAALPFLNSVMAEQVDYFGKKISKAEYLRNQTAFAQRWPVRKYTEQPGSVAVACDSAASACTVKGVVAFVYGSAARHATVLGNAAFSMTVTIDNTPNGERLLISAQSGERLDR